VTGRDAPQSRELWDEHSVARYLLNERIGIGATAEVFRGTDRRDGRPVAIKVAALADDRQRERLAAEAALMAGVRHPALVRFIDQGTAARDSLWAGRAFLVQELVYGSSLAERIRLGPTPGDEVAPWAVGLLSGLRMTSMPWAWCCSNALRESKLFPGLPSSPSSQGLSGALPCPGISARHGNRC